MTSIESFIDFLKQRGKQPGTIELAQEVLEHYYEFSVVQDLGLDSVRNYCASNIAGKPDAVNRIIVLFWYADFQKKKEAGTYLVTLLGTSGVIESQKDRLEQLYGAETAEKVFHGFAMPPLGSDLSDYPEAINSYLRRMTECLKPDSCRKVLAGNHHDINPEGFSADKALWQASEDLDEFLRQKHQRLIDQLQEHADTGKLWFEQYITADVVTYVKEHQDIQTGIRQDNKIIVSKIPYNPDAWIKETDPVRKRFFACHCPFARYSILTEKPVDSLWCYCSGGFTKLFFDYLYDQDLEVELLESVLSGAECCRFSIRLPE